MHTRGVFSSDLGSRIFSYGRNKLAHGSISGLPARPPEKQHDHPKKWKLK